MSKKSVAPLWFKVKQSLYLLVFIVAIHFLAIISITYINIDLSPKALLLILVVSSFYFYVQGYRQGDYLYTIRYTEGFSWEILNQESYTAIRILHSSVLCSFIIILHIEIENKKRHLLICSDAVSPESYRQLFVTLKITHKK